jgi:hypothetical protein
MTKNRKSQVTSFAHRHMVILQPVVPTLTDTLDTSSAIAIYVTTTPRPPGSSIVNELFKTNKNIFANSKAFTRQGYSGPVCRERENNIPTSVKWKTAHEAIGGNKCTTKVVGWQESNPHIHRPNGGVALPIELQPNLQTKKNIKHKLTI